jgi:hypothetical protein
MDMNSRMAMAEKLSVQQLQQAVQSGSLPAYIGIPLIEQKTKERAQMAAAQQGQQKPPSVAASILQQADAQEQQERGIDELPSNLPMMEDEEMGMAGGGIVAFADEGQVVDPNAPPVPAVPPAAMSKYGGIESISPEGRAKFAEYEGLLKDLRGKGGSEREQAKAMAIFQAGLGMMGGTSPNAFANIAAGAMPAVTQYQSALKDIRKEDRDTLKQMLDLGVTKEQFLQKAQQMGIDVYKADRAYDATMGAARMRTAAEKQPQRITDQREFVADYVQKAKDAGSELSDATLRVAGATEYLKLYGAAGQRADTGQAKVESTTTAADIKLVNDARTNVDSRLSKDFNSLENRTIRAKRKADNKNGTNTAAEYKQTLYDAEVDAIRKAAGTVRNTGGANPPRAGANSPPAGANPPPAGANPPPAGGGSANIPPAAVEMLRGDPSPERRRLFDATFGAGASDRVLQ